MRTALLTLAVGGLLAAGLAVPANAAHEELVVTGLGQNGKLVTFLAGTGERLSQVKVTGIDAGQTLAGIDYRPATGGLYGVAVADGLGTLYLIDDETGVAKAVDATKTFPVTGAVSIDFNPTVDRLRVVSTSGDNLRVNPITGARADVPNDGRLAGGSTVVGAAYTNNDNDCIATPAVPCPATATGTTLYDIDAAGDRLLIQNPPNSGGLVPVGPLGIDVDEATGFDVYSERLTDGTTRNIALLSTRTGGGTQVYTVNLTDNPATPANEAGSVNKTATSGVRAQGAPVVDIAVPTDQ